MRSKQNVLCLLFACVAGCDQLSSPGTAAASKGAAASSAAAVPRAFEPLPAAPTPAAKAGWAELEVAAQIADRVAACRADPTAARQAAVLAAIAEMRRVHEASSADAAKMTGTERAIGFGRFVTYLTETSTQLRLLQMEQPEGYTTLMMRLTSEQPTFLQMLPVNTGASADASATAQASQVQTLRAQIELFKLQHDEDALDLRMGWAQLLKRTDASGRITDAGKFGPYLNATPVNRLTGGSQICIVSGEANRIPVAGHNGYDFLYHLPSGRFYSVDTAGKLVEADADVIIPASSAPRLSSARPGIKITAKPRSR